MFMQKIKGNKEIFSLVLYIYAENVVILRA